MTGLAITALDESHWAAVRCVYEEGIATGQATFETAAPEWDDWSRKYRPDCRLVVLRDREVIAWAALSPASSRCVYSGVAEVSIYVAATARGQGVGRLLLRRLVEAAEAAGIWTLQAGIFPENEASIALHQSAGFRVVGRRERIGRLHNVWRDILLLERRSRVIGV